MPVSPFLFPLFRAFDSNGNPLSGGKVYTFAAGTVTPKATYNSSTGLVANSNPVILDSGGYAEIWGDGTYYLEIYDSSDELVKTVENFTNDRGSQGLAGTINVVTAGGTVNAITADYSPDITLANNTTVGFVSTGANTSTTPTFSPDGSTDRTIVRAGGLPLVPGDIGAAGSVHLVTYNLANTRWELLNPAGAPTVLSWTPSPTNVTVVGTPTYTGKYWRNGNVVFVTLNASATTSIAATNAYFSGLPVTVANDTAVSVVNSASTASIGVGQFLGASDRLYVPNFSAIPSISAAGFYFV